jgi:hypothetical protein
MLHTINKDCIFVLQFKFNKSQSFTIMETHKPRGRPRTEPYTTFTMTVPISLEELISEYRFAHKIPSHTEAVRTLLKAGLQQFTSQGAQQ